MKEVLKVGLLFITQIINAQSITEDAFTIDKNKIQLEGSFIIERYNEEGIRNLHWTLPAALMRYGLNENIELRMATSYEGKKHVHRLEEGKLSNLEIGLKMHLINKKNMHLSVINHLLFPSELKELTKHKVNAITSLVYSNNLTDNIEIGGAVQYVFEEAAQRDFNYSLIMNFDVSDNWTTYIETYGELLSNQIIYNFDTGIGYKLSEKLEWQLSYGINIKREYYFVSTGMVWQLN